MRAYVVRAPRVAGVVEVPEPVAAAGEVIVAVSRVGVCGTDVEFYAGTMQYLASGRASYPMRLGHEWCGRVIGVGDDVDPQWVGRRVTGDTMLGCGACRRCTAGRHHVCERLVEVGISLGRPGALAERLAVPVTAIHVLPATVDDTAGAMVEPGGVAWRAATTTRAGEGDRVLVCGPGTVGLLAAMFVRAAGAEVHLLGEPGRTSFAHSLGFAGVWTEADLPDLPWDAVIDATTGTAMPARAVDLVEPGGRVVLVGLAGEPSLLDTRLAVLRDVSVVGILGGSAGLAPAIAAYAAGTVDPGPLVGAVVGMAEVADVLSGVRQPAGGPKTQVDVGGAR